MRRVPASKPQKISVNVKFGKFLKKCGSSHRLQFCFVLFIEKYKLITVLLEKFLYLRISKRGKDS
ncbi:hypothetical protein LEP1GSC062_2930 [Leptospira alexanderi serovar Manhao 3 str. L 60]|uniref:Uncharacterized protein n=1 Tax=Leptospira alexanderi serovar Manhao 3 str. L 60 TaxID=1049759 RepID=V6IBS7_9LEPT|nr:hypothetical protein LEP1GSC062_2930 [Leptospira alexanderi serovar Manhao 3 str. L 60]